MTSRERFEAWYFDTYMKHPTTWESECAKLDMPVPKHKDDEYYLRDDQLMWTAWQANEPKWQDMEPVAYLWQHGETGRTRIVMPDQVITMDAGWIVVGPLVLAAPPSNVTGD